MLHKFQITEQTEYFPEEKVGSDGLPLDWKEHRAHRCTSCGRTAWGEVFRYCDENGRRTWDVYEPELGRDPNSDVKPECDPAEVTVWATMGS